MEEENTEKVVESSPAEETNSGDATEPMSTDAGENKPNDVEKETETPEPPAVDLSGLQQEYCELFKNRYTEEDEEYVAVTKREPAPPPNIFPWYNKPRRNYDYRKFNYNRNYDRKYDSGRGRNRNWNDRPGRWAPYNNPYHNRYQQNQYRQRGPRGYY